MAASSILLFRIPGVSTDPAVADNVVDLWTRFAKTGNPNGGMDITWPNYTRERDSISISISPRP